jgi:hypothetical protein
MKKRIIHLLFFISLLSGLNGQCEFPEKCLGVWEGNMKIYSEGILKDSVNVRLTVENGNDQDIYNWKTEYLSDKYPVVKDYRMKCPSKGSNKYIIDEGDGIEIFEYLFENKLYSVFETSGYLLTSTYELIDEKLIFEVTSGIKIKTEDKIQNYSVRTLQRVVLQKLNKK